MTQQTLTQQVQRVEAELANLEEQAAQQHKLIVAQRAQIIALRDLLTQWQGRNHKTCICPLCEATRVVLKNTEPK